MPTRSTPALGLAVLIGALLLSGCGSSSKSPSSSSTAAQAVSAAGGPTKAQFSAQAEAICRSLANSEKPLEAQQAALKSETATSSGAFVSVARQVVALSRAADAKLHALPRPAAYAGPIGKLLAAFSEDVAYANDLAQAAAKEESDIGEAAERGLRRSITANSHLAGEFGLKLCTGSE
jgi:hypothetical protein